MSERSINRLLRLVAALLACVGTASHATGIGDPLQRPAVASSRSTTSMMTAVTRAGDRMVAVGERGIILVSTDSGQHWVQAKVPVSVLLTAVRFATPMRGWAVGHGGVVLASTDGGMTWVAQLDGIKVAALMTEAAAAYQGDAAKAEKMRADADRLVREGDDKPFLDLDVNDEAHVTVVGAFGLTFHTDDGGAHWNTWTQRIPNAAGNHLYGIAHKGDVVAVAGEQGSVYRSDDRGDDFSEKPTPSKISNFGLLMSTQQRWLVFGLRGKAFVSDDAGNQWKDVVIDSSASLTAGLVLNDGTIVLSSQSGSLYASADGGHVFKPVKVANPVPTIALAQAPDGSLVLAGIRGMNRVAEPIVQGGK